MADFKRFRKVNKLTQGEAAELFGVSQAFISQIEKGIRPIPAEFISKVSGIESIDHSLLLSDYEDVQPTKQLEFDFNKWLEVEREKAEIENKKASAAIMNAESFKKVADSNEKLVDTNGKMYEDNRSLILKIADSLERLEKKIDRGGALPAARNML